MKQKFEEYLKCLYAERFFDAHEALESIWFDRRFEQNDEIKILKGLINAAVSFELMKRNRPLAAQKVWKTYLKYKPLIETTSSQYKEEFLTLSWHVEKLHAMKNA